MENAKGKKWNSMKKSGEKKYDLQIRTCVGRAEKEQQAVSEPNIQSTSEKGTKQKKSVDEDKALCPQKIIQDNKRVKLGENTWINSITAKTATIQSASLRQGEGLVLAVKAEHRRLEIRNV